MPNINLLQTITSATDDGSYFVVSDKGLARRFKFGNFVAQLKQTIADVGRTNQDLNTTDAVVFKSVVLQDHAETINETEHAHGFQSDSTHADGSSLKFGDFVGSLRFGGYDGIHNTILDHGLSSSGLAAVATEDWACNGEVTTNAGTGLFLYHQPAGIQLTTSSRVSAFFVSSTSTSAGSQPTSTIRIGSVSSLPHPISTSSDGLYTFTGPGRSDVFFVNSRVYHTGIPVEDPAPENATLTGTNSISFISSRGSTFAGYRQPVKTGDTIGAVLFRGTNVSNSVNFGVDTAQIRVHATSDFTANTRGSSMHIITCSSSTGASPVFSVDIQPERILYAAAKHSFINESYGRPLSIIDGKLYFNDNTIQQTAYPGFVGTVPSNSFSQGTQGQMAFDANYIYVCISTDRWKRIAASDF